MRHSSVIVNHRIALPGTPQHRSASGSMLEYIATRQGVDREPTEDDMIRHEVLKGLGYVAYRPGAVPEPGTDCALFDQNGVADFKGIRKKLSGNASAVIQSIIAVRREDAGGLGLKTKENFQRLLRSEWSKHIERMGAMSRQDVRWVAAFHTNSERNWHVHVITWDASGRFDSLIPRRKLESARRDLVYKAMEPARHRVSLVKAQARDDLVKAIGTQPLSTAEARSAKDIAESFPKRGSLLYANLRKDSPEIAGKVSDLVSERIGGDPSLGRLVSEYRAAVEKHADLKGLSGETRKTYIEAADSDLASRLANAQIRQIRGLHEQSQSVKQIPIASALTLITEAITQGSPYQPHDHPRYAPLRMGRRKHRNPLAPGNKKKAMHHGI